MGQPPAPIRMNEVINVKRNQKIRVEAYVHVGDQLVNVDDLNQEQKVRLSNELAVTMLNAAYAGVAKFRIKE